MQKSTHTPHYQAVMEKLVSMRKDAGLTQRELAEKLGREHSFVWRIEHGERRLDVVEFYTVCRCLDQDPATVYNELAKAFRREDRRERRQG
jgi:transcriptional regulator with XRE-family HTH domain